MTRSLKPARTLVALLAAAGLTLSACGTTDSNTSTKGSDSGSSSSGAVCDKNIAFFGALTGPAAGLGQQILNGVQLAVDQYNEKNADCKVGLKEYDSQGNPDQAPQLATQAAGDESVLGLVGPCFSGESAVAGSIFSEAGLPTISPSATNPDLAKEGWDTFHRLLGNDATQGPAAAKYISDTVGAKKVFVMDDASEYGEGLATIVKKDLGSAVVGTDTIQQGDTDFSTSATKVKASGADALFFGGYYAEAGLLVSQLRDSGWQGTFVAADGVKDPGFIDSAKKNAEGAVLTCPCIPPEDPAVAEFAKAYKAQFNADPGTYTAEAYDAANVFLNGLAAGKGDRAAMLEWVNSYDEPGITKQVKFNAEGEPAEVPVYAYKVEGGKIVSAGEIS